MSPLDMDKLVNSPTAIPKGLSNKAKSNILGVILPHKKTTLSCAVYYCHVVFQLQEVVHFAVFLLSVLTHHRGPFHLCLRMVYKQQCLEKGSTKLFLDELWPSR